LFAYLKANNVAATKLDRILEGNWDKAEDYGSETALSKTNQPFYEEVQSDGSLHYR
jgi:hypothetical protein